MRTRTVLIPILTLAVLLGAASCGDDDDGPPADQVPTSPAVTDPLADSDWVVTTVIEQDVLHPAPSDDLILAFNGADTIRIDLACNTAGGAYVADQDGDGTSGSIAINDLASTAMACVGVEDWSLLAEALTEATTWST
ncbi:MAG: META domain-containing protein, partial [Acidobacteria bacterium]|nr:META domain-containing protein [Acidobacteriota bacterium]